MFKKTSLILSTIALAAAMLLSAQAHADTLNLVLANPTQSGAPGDTLDFTATASAPITNTGTIFLNSDSFTIDAPLTLDDSGFLNNFFSVDPGQSFSNLLSAVSIPTGTAVGSYLGSFSILGGSDGNTFDVLDTADFEVDVAPAVPEPTTLLFLATGLLGLAVPIRRKMSRSAIQ